ncbi:MAG: hypothetical protein QXO02_05815 [Thermofilaceae archaeon]
MHQCLHAAGPACGVHRACNELRLLNAMLPYRHRLHEVEAYAKEGSWPKCSSPARRGRLGSFRMHSPLGLRCSALLLYLEPGGRGAEGPRPRRRACRGVHVSKPVIIYWLEGIFLSEKEGEIYVEGAGGAYVVLGKAAGRLYGKLRQSHTLDERGGAERGSFRLYSIRPERARRNRGWYYEVELREMHRGEALAAVRVRRGERTWPYGRVLEDLKKAGELLQQTAEFYKEMLGATSN